MMIKKLQGLLYIQRALQPESMSPKLESHLCVMISDGLSIFSWSQFLKKLVARLLPVYLAQTYPHERVVPMSFGEEYALP